MLKCEINLDGLGHIVMVIYAYIETGKIFGMTLTVLSKERYAVNLNLLCFLKGEILQFKLMAPQSFFVKPYDESLRLNWTIK